jgi:hypothetical protein
MSENYDHEFLKFNGVGGRRDWFAQTSQGNQLTIKNSFVGIFVEFIQLLEFASSLTFIIHIFKAGNDSFGPTHLIQPMSPPTRYMKDLYPFRPYCSLETLVE